MDYVSEITDQLCQIILKSNFNRSAKLEKLVEKELEHQEFIHDGRKPYRVPSGKEIFQLSLKFAAVYASYGLLNMGSPENLKRMGTQVGIFLEDLGFENFFGRHSWVEFNQMLQDPDFQSRYPKLWRAILSRSPIL